MSESRTPQRLFKTGSSYIRESPHTQGLSVQQVQALLQPVYPELAHATTRETLQEDGTLLVEFTPVVGRKG